MTRRTVAAFVAFTIAALSLVACGGSDITGTVQDKRQSAHSIAPKRELCIGDSKTSCTWQPLTGKYASGWYGRCDIGEYYPDCTALF